MGPVWDFDLAYGNHSYEDYNLIEKWRSLNYWNLYLLNDLVYKSEILKEWKNNYALFESVKDSIDCTSLMLKKAAQNNFKRWNILTVTKNWLHKSFQSYDEAVVDLKEWINQRIQWIESQFKE
jgi:hypothetical protein